MDEYENVIVQEIKVVETNEAVAMPTGKQMQEVDSTSNCKCTQADTKICREVIAEVVTKCKEHRALKGRAERTNKQHIK